MLTKTEAVKAFLERHTHPDLATMYNENMEVQVNVLQGGGERIQGSYMNREWRGYTDGINIWKSFRIPYNADSKPEYRDRAINFDIEEYVESIGMTGWDWKNQVSKWVAFDFDALIGHSPNHRAKLTSQELAKVQDAAREIPWVTVRRSTSGRGLHLYVFLPDVPTQTHTEHAALGRAVLGKMSAVAGFDFQSKVDACGGNMWVYHRKMVGTDGLTLIKQGDILHDVPPEWECHLNAILNIGKKSKPHMDSESFNTLVSRSTKIDFDDEHKALIKYLEENGCIWWWDQDRSMLVTHTEHLASAYKHLGMRGYFETSSTRSSEHNCFCFPLRRGAWVVRRFTQGVAEHESWIQDGQGWTMCYLNREPDLSTACSTHGGLEDPKSGFIFREAEVAVRAALMLGVVLDIHDSLLQRETVLKQHKDGRLIVSVRREHHDTADKMKGWLAKKDFWVRIYAMRNDALQEQDTSDCDDIIRHIVTGDNEDCGWVIKAEGSWRTEPLAHVKVSLGSLGYDGKRITSILGNSIFKCWKLVNKPFQDEYPGNREWNRNAAQLRYALVTKDNLNFSTWERIMDHCGRSLDHAIQSNDWARNNGITRGADYLKIWIASMLQFPHEPLPYLFFWGSQDCGKSILHEALSLLMTRGYSRADAALVNPGGFNGELEGIVLCVVEETDLSGNKQAYRRIKDWVTGREMLIHPKRLTPYNTPNTSHWIQCDNDPQACPVFPGDTRITVFHVEDLDPQVKIPKREMLRMLEKEAADFLTGMMRLEIPPSHDRLNVPVISSSSKEFIQVANQTPIENFISEACRTHKGSMIKFSDFYDRFIYWLEDDEKRNWSKKKVGKSMPPSLLRGRRRGDAQHCIGHIAWIDDDSTIVGSEVVQSGDYLDVLE